MSKHIKSGAQKVILTAPAKGNIKNIVNGVNNNILEYAEEDGVVVVEIAAAPIMDDLSEDIMKKISGAKKAYVFYNGEEKPYGCGEPASNFRSKVSILKLHQN